VNIQAKDVAANEDLRQPVDAYQRVFGRVRTADEATEDHVDGSREEDGRQEDKCGLDDVGRFVQGVVVSSGASRVAYSFTLA
jgi:hypothetical protein